VTEAAPNGRPSGDDGVLAEVGQLRVVFGTSAGTAAAVRGVSFQLAKGETVGLVGESGSGKSVTALSLMGLLPRRGCRIEAERLSVMGTDIMSASSGELQDLRGSRVAMIFQDPLRSLSPTKRVGDQIAEVLMRHRSMSKRPAQAEAAMLLRRVGVPDPVRRARDYRHQFSGGQRQRIMIAMAIACSPGLLIADEPTTALDVTTQAQILDLILDLRAELDMGVLLITHDLSVIARVCDRVLVMYAGRLVEAGDARDIFRSPKHPYTAGLLASIPRVDQPNREIRPIAGTPLDATDQIVGCPFRPRCPLAVEQCLRRPDLVEVAPRHLAACWRADEVG
jgi:oligopeptide/dipeptide ABC transporter ATP-binding protein